MPQKLQFLKASPGYRFLHSCANPELRFPDPIAKIPPSLIPIGVAINELFRLLNELRSKFYDPVQEWDGHDFKRKMEEVAMTLRR